jgi:dihydropteroate synthase-like protein
MADRLLFLTGHLAEARLRKIIAAANTDSADWRVVDIGVKVAALMTEAIIERRLAQPVAADRVVLPGRCRVDLDRLTARFGVPFVRGPDELRDLPRFLGRGGMEPDLSRHDTRIFAEIVDAPQITTTAIVERARNMRAAGADVIDVGCLPDTPFPHLDEAVRALKQEDFAVSVDSADMAELARGARGGADYLLSLNGETLSIAADTGATPVLVPGTHGKLKTLFAAMERADAMGLRYIVDPVLDPIHFGFSQSLQRYAEVRRRYPAAEMLMGTGNLTELTDADSAGVTAVLMGICSELAIRNVLVVNVSPHTRRTIEEHDAARRIMYAARSDTSLPRDYSDMLLQVHDRSPFPSLPQEIAELASGVRDRNFRIETAEDGIHVYNSEGHHVARDAMSLFPKLDVGNDGPHAFYLGAELMKAELAYRLGKRYAQDEPLNWGVADKRPVSDMTRQAAAGHTLRARHGRS